jgi:hypothetical protein
MKATSYSAVPKRKAARQRRMDRVPKVVCRRKPFGRNVTDKATRAIVPLLIWVQRNACRYFRSTGWIEDDADRYFVARHTHTYLSSLSP